MYTQPFRRTTRNDYKVMCLHLLLSTCFYSSHVTNVRRLVFRGKYRLVLLQLCKRAGRLGFRGTSPLRKKGRSDDALSSKNPLSSRAPSLLRYGRNHSDPIDSSDSRFGGRSTRPWTTGELAGNDSGDGATTARIGGLLQNETGQQTRARSADGVSSSPHPVNSGLRSASARLDGAVDPLDAKIDGLVGSADGVSKDSSHSVETSGANRQEEQGETLDIDGGIDGAAADEDDCGDSEFPLVFSQQMPRRVSFADEQGSSDGSGDSTEQADGQNQHRAGRGSQRRRMSSIVGSSNGYLEGDGSINGNLLNNDGRRKSDLERCRRAMEIARVAHDLLFLDTRPDGLRPITGTPMTDGKNAQGSGGLYVGLAGLRSFDLSFVGAVATDESDPRQSLGSVAGRLAASRRLSAFATTNEDESSAAEMSQYSSPNGAISSSSKAEASWITQGFLLDREPGSLVPRLPQSAGKAPAAEIGQVPPTKNDSTNSEVVDEGSVLSTSEAVASDRRTPTANGNSSEVPMSPASLANTQQAQKSATGDDAKTASLHAKERNPEMHDGRGEVCGRSQGGESTRREFDGKSGALVPEVPSGTTVMSSAATAVASLFTPKAAVLWSARDLGVDELVLSVSGDQEVTERSIVFSVVYFEVSANHVTTKGTARGSCLVENYNVCCNLFLAHVTMRHKSAKNRGVQTVQFGLWLLLSDVWYTLTNATEDMSETPECMALAN